MATNPKEKQRQYDAKRRATQGKRSRGWAGILYDDSAAPDAIDQLGNLHIEVLVSPVHDQDTDGAGNSKKPHRHVLLMFPNPVPATKAKAIWDAIGAVPEKDGHGNMRPVESLKGYARYLVHLDDHDKHRYVESDIIELGGASWDAVALDEAELVDSAMNEIEDWIDENGITSYRTLCRYARSEMPEWTRVIRSHTIHFTNYVKSVAWEVVQEDVEDI